MELKFVYCALWIVSSGFELNLYGIEMKQLQQSLMGITLFELNLYGIEMRVCYIQECRFHGCLN